MVPALLSNKTKYTLVVVIGVTNGVSVTVWVIAGVPVLDGVGETVGVGVLVLVTPRVGVLLGVVGGCWMNCSMPIFRKSTCPCKMEFVARRTTYTSSPGIKLKITLYIRRFLNYKIYDFDIYYLSKGEQD
jgi:hypothetical protein